MLWPRRELDCVGDVAGTITVVPEFIALCLLHEYSRQRIQKKYLDVLVELLSGTYECLYLAPSCNMAVAECLHGERL